MQVKQVLARRTIAFGAAALATGVLPSSGRAEDYPTRPILVVVNFPAGAGVDLLTRLFAAKLGPALGQPVVVENRGGAGGNIGAGAVARATPDGYTLLATPSSIATNQTLYRRLSFSLERDLTPVALLGFLPFVLVTSPSLRAGSVSDFIALARQRPEGLTYASTGNGTSPHLLGEEFRARTGLDMQHVPYQGSGQAMNDVLGGRVDMMFANPLSVLPYLQSGRLVALGIATPQRNPALPEVPTLGEAGLPGFETGSWYGLFAPAGTPEAIVRRLNAAVVAVSESPELRQQLAAQAAEPRSGTPEEVAAFVHSEVEKLGRIVNAARLQVD